ncbi:MAG: hypothetical protein ACD_22C00009G0001, partial [uncultured bacterium]
MIREEVILQRSWKWVIVWAEDLTVKHFMHIGFLKYGVFYCEVSLTQKQVRIFTISMEEKMDETTALPAETAAFDIKAFAALIYNDDSVFEALAAEVGALRQLRDEAVAHQFELNQQAEEKRLADAAVRTRRGLLLAMERLETKFVRTSA